MKISQERKIVRLSSNQQGGMMWAVREISEGVLAVGFFDRAVCQIYKEENLIQTIDVGLRIFGFVIPPTANVPSTGMPP